MSLLRKGCLPTPLQAIVELLKKGVVMRKLIATACAILVSLIFLGCTAPERVSLVENYKSQDHKAIYELLEANKERFNQRKGIDLSRLTENARIKTQYHDEDAFLSPQKLKKKWPEKSAVLQSHEFHMKSIEVEDLSINGDKARVKTKRTLVSDRWKTAHEYTFEEVYKKRDGEWKLHWCNVRPQSCTDCH